MANIKDHVTGTDSARPGIGGELKQLKSNGSATAGELREFIGSLQGKSPQEMLGAVAQSGLTQGIVLATIGFMVILVACTVVPYGYHKFWPSTASAATASSDENQSADTQAGADDTANSEQPVAVTDDAPAGAGDLTDKLGIGETKTSDPKSNPLDSKSNLDNLLDGID